MANDMIFLLSMPSLFRFLSYSEYVLPGDVSPTPADISLHLLVALLPIPADMTKFDLPPLEIF